jgi:hypothetical protein
MKGQLIFEFIVAGLIFFAIVLYSINFLNTSVADFSGKFYQSRLQSKAAQIAEILVSGESGLSVADDLVFNVTKIQLFNSTRCGDTQYRDLVRDFYLYEKTDTGMLPENAKITLATEDGTLLDCGPKISRNVAKADVERIGLFQGKIAKLRVTVW